MQRKHGTEPKKREFFPVARILPLKLSLLNFIDVSLILICASNVEKQGLKIL